MTITENFKKGAKQYPGWLDPERGKLMEERGYIFLAHRQTDNGPWIPNPSWKSLVNKLGGEDAIEADFDRDNDPAFTVTHIESGKTTEGNGAVHVLADLWLEIN